MGILEVFRTNPIVAAVRDVTHLDDALAAPAAAIFMLTGELLTLRTVVQQARAAGKPIFFHLDLVRGLSSDKAGIDYLSQEVKPDGVITTKGHVVELAKDSGLVTIQRIFALDSLAVQTGISLVKQTRPDFVEILPGIVPRIIPLVVKETRVPVIAGGLIHNRADIDIILKAGAVAVSASKREVWYINYTRSG